MASLTLRGLNDRWPEGTSLTIRPESNFGSSTPPVPGQAPLGSATDTQTVSGDAVTFVGLAADTAYVVTDSGGTKYVHAGTRIDHGGVVHSDANGMVSAAQGGFPMYGITQQRFGGVGDGVVNDRSAMLAAVQACEATGGTVVWEYGKNFLLDGAPLPINPLALRTGWMELRGYGAKITIGPNAPSNDRGFLKSGRTADGQTISKLITRGFEIDGGKLNALSSEGLAGGNIMRVAGTAGQKINLEDLIFEDIYSHGIAKPSTYGTGSGTFNNQTHLYLAPFHSTQGLSQNTIKRVYVNSVRMESGVHGVFIGANVGSGTGAEVYYNDVYIDRCSMDHLETHTTPTGSCFQIGSHAYGDRAGITRSTGVYSNDSCFEVNACQHLVYHDLLAIDPVNMGLYARDFHAPQDALAKQWFIDKCVVKMVNLTPNNGTIPGRGIQIGALSTDVWGLVSIEDYLYDNPKASKYDNNGGGSASTNQGHAIYLLGSQAKEVRLKDVYANELGLAVDTTVQGFTGAPISIRPQTTTAKMTVILDGVHVRHAGTVTALPNALTMFPYRIEADPTGAGSDITIDQRLVTYDNQLPTNANFAWGGGSLGMTSGGIFTTLRGSIRRHTPSGTSTTGGSIGLRVGGADRCTIDKQLVVESSDLSGVTTNNQEIQIASGTTAEQNTNKAKILTHDVVLRTTSTLGGAAPIAITPGASPYTYQNLDMLREEVRITGGTVSDISHSRDNSTFGTIAAATGERVLLEPGHSVKVTYTVAPTMTKTLQR